VYLALHRDSAARCSVSARTPSAGTVVPGAGARLAGRLAGWRGGAPAVRAKRVQRQRAGVGVPSRTRTWSFFSPLTQQFQWLAFWCVLTSTFHTMLVSAHHTTGAAREIAPRPYSGRF